MKDPTQTDFRLWLISSGGLAGAIIAAALIVSVSAGGLQLRDVPGVLPGFLILIVPCAVVGWFAQLIATSCGLHLPRRSRSDEAADYDDAPPAKPPDRPV
jgi:hypothetical protein